MVGEVIEPQAQCAAELAEMNHRLAVNPDDAEALVHRGWLFLQEKKWPAAIADLDRRLRLRPDDADACCLLAEAYHGVGNMAGALAAINRLLERAPEDRDARFLRGLIALAGTQPDLALDDFTRILAAEPDRERARYHRARALIRLRRHREALAELDRLLAKDPNDDALYQYQLRSIVHEALGDRDQARRQREGPRAPSYGPPDAELSGLDACDRAHRSARPRVSRGGGAAICRTGPRPAEAAHHPWCDALSRGAPTPTRFRSWSGAWPRPKASSTPSKASSTQKACSSWRWPTTGWGTRARPAIASTGPCDRGTSIRTCWRIMSQS